MKYLFAFVVLAFSQQGNAFSFQNGQSARSQSALFMTVKEKETKTIKVGVIGCGRIGLVHLEAINKAPGVTPIIVSNPTISKAEKGQYKYPWIREIGLNWLSSILDYWWPPSNSFALAFHNYSCCPIQCP